MDDSGTIYRICKKCGYRVVWHRDCPGCGENSETADDLASQLSELIKNETPDPLGKMRDWLREQHQKRNRGKSRL